MRRQYLQAAPGAQSLDRVYTVSQKMLWKQTHITCRPGGAENMGLRRNSLISLFIGALLPLSLSDAQVLPPRSNTSANAGQQSLQRKKLIERHFESIQPRPRAQFGGAVPGARLLEQRSIRAAMLQNRVRMSPAVVSEDSGGGNAKMPGIQLRPTLPAGSIPTSVVTGDFNQDGHMDFIVANAMDNDLWIYLGNGDGTFQLPRVIPLSKGLSPVGLATGDLRGNGKLDLVVAESDSSSIGVLLGNGDGTFGYETEYALPEPPASVVIDNFNHSGKLGIAAVMVTTVDPGLKGVPFIALLSGNGDGTFATPVITNTPGSFYSTAWNIASGDVNNDGLPDLLATGPGMENSEIFINNGDGTFTAGQVIGGGSPLDGRLADVNGDGCLDAVIADPSSSSALVALGDCSGHFTSPIAFPVGDSPAAIRVVDVNGDGIPDIVTSALPAQDPTYGAVAGNVLSVLPGDGKGNFGIARNYVGASQAYSIGVADFNGDGSPDFVTANNDSDTVTVYQNDKGGAFGFPQGVYAGIPGVGIINAPISAVSFVDLNNDGKTDAFFLDEGYAGEYYTAGFLNDGTAKFSNPITSDTGISSLQNYIGDYHLGNFRDAAHEDMVAIGLDQAFSGSGQFILFSRGNGDGTFAKSTLVVAAGADGLLTTGDFNRDGKLDFVAVNGQGTHTLTTFLGNGDGTFRALAPVTFADSQQVYATRIYTGDFNRDGKLDVLVFTTGNGYWLTGSTVWEFDGNGDGTFQAPRQLFTDFQPFALADVNDDGFPDIARYDSMWPDGTTQTIGPAKFTTYLGQPAGSFNQSSSYAPYAGVPVDVQPYFQFGDPLASSLVADLNGDGKPEELAFQRLDANIGNSEKYAQILMGNGDGTFTPTYDVFPFYILSYPVYASRLDGSGASDLVNLVSGTSSLQVYKAAPAPALQIGLRDSVVTGNASCGWVFPNVASSSAQSATLSSSVIGVLLPASVTVPANATSAQFCYTLASNFDWHQVFDINAQLNGDTATAYASDSYTLGFSELLSAATPAAIYAGQSTNPATITLTSSQGYGSTATLYCEELLAGDSCQFANSTLSVSPGAPSSTTVIFVTSASDNTSLNPHPFTVAADDGNVIQRQTADVNVASLYMYPLPSSLQTVAPGTVSTYVSINGVPPYSFSCSGLPAGATCSSSGTAAPYPSNSSLTLTISVPSGTAPGSYPLKVTATSGPDTASENTTLQVLSINMQGPPTNNDWSLANFEQEVPITVSANLSTSGSILITCSLDVGGTCDGTPVSVATTAQTSELTISIPSSASTGQHVLTVTATYGAIVQSFTFPFYIADYGGTLSPSSLTLNPLGSGTVTATLNATTDFVGAIALACTGTTQVSCNFNPATTQLTGGTSPTVTITLLAGANASSQPPSAPFLGRRLLALAALLPLGIAWNLRRRKWWTVLFCLVASVVLLLPVVSCGSGGAGGGGGGGGGGSNYYSVTVTASFSNTTRTLGTVSVSVNK